MMPLWFALFLLVVVAVAAGSFRSASAAAVLLANWCVCAVLYRLTGDQYPWLTLAAIDLIAGCVILAIPFQKRGGNRLQVLLASTYAIGLGLHAWYGQTDHGALAQYQYWYGMHYMAWSQLWIAVSWTTLNVVGLARDADYPWRRVLVRRSVPDAVVRR